MHLFKTAIVTATTTAIAISSAMAAAAPNVSPAGTAPSNTRTLVNQNKDLTVSSAAKLVSLSLKETNIPWMNPVNVKYSLSANKPIKNCRLEYQLQTNDAGKPALTLWPSLDFSVANSYDVSLPVQEGTFGFGTLELNNIPVKSGSFRVIVRAKATPTNTCVGEVRADFVFLPKP